MALSVNAVRGLDRAGVPRLPLVLQDGIPPVRGVMRRLWDWGVAGHRHRATYGGAVTIRRSVSRGITIWTFRLLGWCRHIGVLAGLGHLLELLADLAGAVLGGGELGGLRERLADVRAGVTDL